MRIIVTAGPTREYIDSIRFLSNASSGRMGCQVARAAAGGGHEVILLAGPGVAARGAQELADRCTVVPFVSVGDLKRELAGRFSQCDALVMAAAVGDFFISPEQVCATKLRRADGPVTLDLIPTEDVLAGVAAGKRPGQIVVAFAVEDGDEAEIEARARAEMAAKNADYVVVNTPAAMDASASRACILSAGGVLLAWADRPKRQLAEEIIALLDKVKEQ